MPAFGPRVAARWHACGGRDRQGFELVSLMIATIVCGLVALGGWLTWLPSQRSRNWHGQVLNREPTDSG